MSGIPTTKEALLISRYGEGGVPDNVLWNDQMQRLLSHRSVRAFLPDPVPNGTIETMVAAAQSASTSSNLQQWSVVAVTDTSIKSKLSKLAAGTIGMGNPFIEEAPLLLLWVADLSRNNFIATAAAGETTVHEYVDSFLMGTIDATLAAQNAAIAAESLGLGVVYVGAMRNKAKEVAALVELPEYSFVTFGLVVGWPDPCRPGGIRPRLPQSSVLHYNTYDIGRSREGVDPYEALYQSFRFKHSMKEKTWKQAVQYAVGDTSYMDGRENLRGTLGERGFKFL